MQILLTNDDGIFADGIYFLYDALKNIGDVTIVAPERERSAAGHGITMHKPLRIKKQHVRNNVYGYSVSGTPADCVKLGLDIVMDVRPDIIISGINNGLNLGLDVLYSGTVSAALEGYINGISALAVSVTENPCDKDYIIAADFIRQIVEQQFMDHKNKKIVLNVNIPASTQHKIMGIKISKQGYKRYENAVHKRTDPRGREYYWLSGDLVTSYPDDNTDLAAIHQNYISITPLKYDLTDYDFEIDPNSLSFNTFIE
jgi:5'-nucleotidase